MGSSRRGVTGVSLADELQHAADHAAGFRVADLAEFAASQGVDLSSRAQLCEVQPMVASKSVYSSATEHSFGGRGISALERTDG